MSISQPKKQKTNSAPSSVEDYAGYSAGFDELTGGRFGAFATQGTPQLTPEQIQAYGGLGVTRTADVNRQRAQSIDAIAADQNLTGVQRQRSTQLTDQDAAARLAAIGKETQADMTGLAQYNNDLTSSDLEQLIKAYYSGKGAVETSKGGGGASASYYG